MNRAGKFLTGFIVSLSLFSSAMAFDEKLVCEYFNKRDLISLDRYLKGEDVDSLIPTSFSDCTRRAIGMWYYSNGRYDRAVEWLESVGDVQLMDLVNLSAALIKMGDLSRARDVLKKAIVKYGDEPHLLFNLALVYIKENDYKTARTYLIKILNSPEAPKSLKSRVLEILNNIGY